MIITPKSDDPQIWLTHKGDPRGNFSLHLKLIFRILVATKVTRLAVHGRQLVLEICLVDHEVVLVQGLLHVG